MKLITISEESKKCLEALDPQYKTVSEMAESEREFLTELILRYKPKKVLEVGVAAGSSSVVMLNALETTDNYEFYSVDYIAKYYKDKSKKVGFILDEYPELAKKRKLYTGGFVSNFLDEIGDGIDFCFIDTMHLLPGEILDFLMVFPYLKENAIVVFHDTNLHMHKNYSDSNVNNMLVSALVGEKLLPETYSQLLTAQCDEAELSLASLDTGKRYPYFLINISAICLDADQKDHIFEVFNLVTQHWDYLPTKSELNNLSTLFKKHYGITFANYFLKIASHQIFCINEKKAIAKHDIDCNKKRAQGRRDEETLSSKIEKLVQKNSELRQTINDLTLELTGAQVQTSSFHALKNMIFQLPLKKKAFELCNTGKLYEAERVALSFIKNNPYISWGYYILGKTYWQQGKKEIAIANLEKAIEMDPYITYYRTLLSSILRLQD